MIGIVCTWGFNTSRMIPYFLHLKQLRSFDNFQRLGGKQKTLFELLKMDIISLRSLTSALFHIVKMLTKCWFIHRKIYIVKEVFKHWCNLPCLLVNALKKNQQNAHFERKNVFNCLHRYHWLYECLVVLNGLDVLYKSKTNLDWMTKLKCTIN